MLAYIDKFIKFSGEAIVIAAGLCVLGAMLLDTFDVISTNFLLTAVPGTIEITETMMVAVVFGGLAATQRVGGHIRMELIYMHVKPWIKALMNMISEIIAIIFFSLMLWTAWDQLKISWGYREATAGLVLFPIYPVRAVIVLGVLILIGQLIMDVIRDIGLIREYRKIDTVK
jgi:TRAP-type mannitol/chloroaromatic compound transport system permease small subunit